MTVTTCHPASDAALALAAGLLEAGELAILPTDTVYGIVADVRRDDAVRALYAAKGKGPEAPLQLLFSDDTSLLSRYAVLGSVASRLVAALGPGGWTIVTRAAPGWVSPALAGGRTVGVRIPASPAVCRIVQALGAPLVASSANRHGHASPTTCQQALAEVGPYCSIALDAGPALSALDSTVIDCAGKSLRILREGAIDRQTVARILGLDDIPVVRSIRP